MRHRDDDHPGKLEHVEPLNLLEMLALVVVGIVLLGALFS